MPDPRPIAAFLDEHHHALAAEYADFARSHIKRLPEPENDDAARVQAREILKVLGAADFFKPIAEADLRACCLAREALGAASPLADSVFALQGLGSLPVFLGGSEALKERWFRPAMAGELMAGFAMTEPQAGSDLSAMATRAVRDGDHYVLNGQKTLISNAGIADFYSVFAVSDPSQGLRGLSCFVVPADTPGLVFKGPQVLSAPHPLGELVFEDCRIPSENLLGSEGQGFKLGMSALDRLRPTVGAAACGMGARALEEAMSYALKREQSGRPIAQFQLVQEKIAVMATELTASRLLVFRAGWEKDHGKDRISLEAAMGKSYATEAAQKIIDDSIQIHGGVGLLANHPVDRLYRSIRALRVYEGTTEILRLTIGKMLLKEAAAE